MGDDLHMRTQAATNLLVRTCCRTSRRCRGLPRQGSRDFLAGNHLFFLTLAMAAARRSPRGRSRCEGSSMVTTMARNGTTFGIRLAGSDRWFVTASPPVGEALYYSGYGPDDAAPDIGDSAVLELVGLGGPAARRRRRSRRSSAARWPTPPRATEDFRRICVGASSRFTLPTLGFRGTPVGVDVRKVVELGITPKVTTGILRALGGAGRSAPASPRRPSPASARRCSTSPV